MTFELWIASADILPAETALCDLSEAERQRLGKYRNLERRAEYATAHILLRRALARHLGPCQMILGSRPCPACGEPHGRPYVRSPRTEFEFSVTHGGGIAAVALCDQGVVGADTEGLVNSATREAITPLLHPAERIALSGLEVAERDAMFTRVWTRKEAYLKAIGIGLGRDVSFDCVLPEHPELHPSGWEFHEAQLAKGHVVALCVPVGTGIPTLRRVNLSDERALSEGAATFIN